jgi:HPt (histidine-containing phosphotransfer) domain-containing protein
MIDRNKFNENFQYFDNEIIVEIIDMFFSEFEERFINLHENVNTLDFEKLKFNAHSIKGVIGNFMDPVTIELSKRLDEMAKNKVENGLEKTLNDLETNTKLLLEELKKIKQELT